MGQGGHSHHHHDHIPNDQRLVFWALLLTGGFMVAEVIGGILSGSLALLADAGHMLTDTAALGLAWFALRLVQRPHDRRRTYGYHRAQVLAAFVNGITLVAIVGWILIEAARRFAAPVPILGAPMLVVASLGLVVNLVAFALLRRGDPENLNLRGAALHVLGDLLGSVAAIVAAVVILWTGWLPIDPLLSIAVALLILRSAWALIKRSAHILLEGAPPWLDVSELRRTLRADVPAVDDIHHVHAWMLTTERPLLTLHAQVAAGTDAQQALAAIHAVLRARFGIDHATVQIETAGCADEPVSAGS